MDFSSPYVGMTPPRKLTTEELMRALRIDVAAELDAINLYQAHIDAIDDEQVKAVIAHIRDEEKEHVAEFMAALNALDAKQKDELESPHPELGIEAGQAQVIPVAGTETQASTESAPQVQPQQAAMEPKAFTVGSLLGKVQS
ncbi:MAG: demethoxyubiquinone hydroxylase family protein [Chloroflexi bacterium]|nr:demethoxyubiquinone hydroxylase family protein [Chloroflexota bacterium]